MHSIQFGNPIL